MIGGLDLWWALVSGQWSVVSGGFSLALLRASARGLSATSLPLFFNSLLGFGSLSHPTDVRQPELYSVWERAGGEGRQAKPNALSSPRRVGVLDKESSTKRSRGFLGRHRTPCWLPDGLLVFSPEWGGSPIAQRRKPWEHRAHQQPTAPNGATEFTDTSHSSARYGAIQS